MNTKLIAMFFGLALAVGVGAALATPEGKIAICHMPPGNTAKARTISIDPVDLQFHLDHGDSPVPCEAE